MVRSTTSINLDGSTNREPLKPLPTNIPWGDSKQVAQAANLGSNPKQFVATIARVSDGDGINFKREGSHGVESCRLAQIDAPEVPHEAWTDKSGKKHKANPAQAYGNEAKNYLASLIENKQVDLTITMSKDVSKQGRNFCQVHIKGQDVNLDMVRKGFALVYDRYISPELKADYYSAQENARKNGKNVWTDPNPIPGEVFRQHYQRLDDTK